jgi:hypothetical protein
VAHQPGAIHRFAQCIQQWLIHHLAP